MRLQAVGRDLFLRDPEAHASTVALARLQLSSLSCFYPEFDLWFKNKVEAGLASGERTLLIRNVGEHVAGIAILKHDAHESKLCCLRVLPRFNGSGVGLKLFEDSFHTLDTDRPLLTVSAEHLPHFKRVFNHFGFDHVRDYIDFYRKGVIEHSFNGVLKTTHGDELPPTP